jgi:hypothetical protein
MVGILSISSPLNLWSLEANDSENQETSPILTKHRSVGMKYSLPTLKNLMFAEISLESG